MAAEVVLPFYSLIGRFFQFHFSIVRIIAAAAHSPPDSALISGQLPPFRSHSLEGYLLTVSSLVKKTLLGHNKKRKKKEKKRKRAKPVLRGSSGDEQS
jgi:hypothetical protein